MKKTTFSKGSQFVFLFEQAVLNSRPPSCFFPHLDSVFLLNGGKSPAHTFTFHNSSSQLLQQPHASMGVRRRRAGSLFHALAAPGREKGFAFLPFPPAGGIPGAGWERNPCRCWNGEGNHAHSFTTVWAGLGLAYYLTLWATHSFWACWPR